MKYVWLALIGLCFGVALALLTSCAADGSFDSAAFRSVTDAALGTYDRYERAQRPETHFRTLYDAYGNPIPGPPYQ